MKPANDNGLGVRPGPQLGQRVKLYNIPPIPYLPMGKNVLVYRMPSETKTAGGIYITETARQAKPMGILVSAGLAAHEVMQDHLIEIGDVVWFGRFHEYEEEVKRDPEGKGQTILQMKIEDVLGSVDALERVREYAIERNEDEQLIYVRKGANHAS